MNERLFRALAQLGLEDIAALTDLTNGAGDTPKSLPLRTALTALKNPFSACSDSAIEKFCIKVGIRNHIEFYNESWRDTCFSNWLKK